MSKLGATVVGVVEDFCLTTGISTSALGRLAVGDHHAVEDLRRGSATLRRLERLDDYMRAERRRRKLSEGGL